MSAVLRRRVERLEAGPAGAPAIRHEIARLEAAISRDFPGDPRHWSPEQVDRYLAEEFAESSRVAELHALHRQAETAAERQAREARVAAMTDAEIDAILTSEWSKG